MRFLQNSAHNAVMMKSDSRLDQVFHGGQTSAPGVAESVASSIDGHFIANNNLHGNHLVWSQHKAAAALSASQLSSEHAGTQSVSDLTSRPGLNLEEMKKSPISKMQSLEKDVHENTERIGSLNTGQIDVALLTGKRREDPKAMTSHHHLTESKPESASSLHFLSYLSSTANHVAREKQLET